MLDMGGGGGSKIPGLNQTYDSGQGSPAISSHAVGASWWDAAIDTIAEMPSHLKEDLTAGLDAAVKGGKAVATGVTDVAGAAVDPVINRVILLVVVLGVTAYFLGKSGFLKMSVSK